MIHIDSQTVIDVAEEQEGLDINVHRRYSGRGMYGDECLAVEYRRNISDAYAFMFELAAKMADINAKENGDFAYIDDVREEYSDLLTQTPRMDNLGNNGLIYWPTIKIND